MHVKHAELGCFAGPPMRCWNGRHSQTLIAEKASHPRLCRKRSPFPASATNASLRQTSRRLVLQLLGGVVIVSPIEKAAAYSSTYSPRKASGSLDEQKEAPRLYEEAKVVSTASGLRYFDISPGADTSVVAQEGSIVTCAYTSRLGGLNGVKLYSSYDMGRNFKFAVGDPNVVPGISEMVKGMHVGGKRRAVIPPTLGYRRTTMEPAIADFFAKRRLLSVLETQRDATIVVDVEILGIR